LRDGASLDGLAPEPAAARFGTRDDAGVSGSVVSGSGWRFRQYEGKSTATFSPCGLYRYDLCRVWKPRARTMVFVGLNPSTADESTDDPTIRRILGFADDWGFGSLVMLNAFAYRSTDPKALHDRAERRREIVGPDNDATIRRTFEEHRRTKLVMGWGAHGTLLDRGRDLARLALSVHRRPECFGLTQNGQPKHPLYLAATTRAVRYAAPMTDL
jgi:hypothetical protein